MNEFVEYTKPIDKTTIERKGAGELFPVTVDGEEYLVRTYFLPSGNDDEILGEVSIYKPLGNGMYKAYICQDFKGDLSNCEDDENSFQNLIRNSLY